MKLAGFGITTDSTSTPSFFLIASITSTTLRMLGL